MRRYVRFIAATWIGFAGHSIAVAADLPRSDPDRAAILQAARPSADIKFVVKDLRKFGDFAFLCALAQISGGGIIGTDDALDVYKWALVKHAGKWHAIDAGGGFARNAKNVSCDIARTDFDPSLQSIENEEDVIKLTVNLVKAQIRSDLDYRQLIDANAPLLRALESKKVLGVVPIEHEKAPFDPVQLKVAKETCASPSCVRDTEKAFHLLSKARTDDAVSSLVWNGCQYGLRALNLIIIQRCVAVASRLPYCRPNMALNDDRKDIGHCIEDIRAMCEKDVPGRCK